MVPFPFDPNQLWGTKARHHVAGTVNGMRARAVIEADGDGLGFVLGPAWRRDCGIEPGERVTVQIAPDGPQREDLPAVAMVGPIWNAAPASPGRVCWRSPSRNAIRSVLVDWEIHTLDDSRS